MTTGGHPPPAYFSHKRRSLVLTVPFAAIRPRGFMSNKTGGPAFPQSGVCTPEINSWDSDDFGGRGITMRDYFAAKAMASIVRRWDGHSFGGGPESPQYKELAEDAYHIADAMLRAREAS